MRAKTEDLSSLFDKANHPVVAVNKNRRVIYANPAAQKLFCYAEKLPKKGNSLLTCYKFIHNMNKKPAHCICGLGSQTIKTRRIYEPSVNQLFELIHIPLRCGKSTIGGINIFEPVHLPRDLEVPHFKKCD